MAHFVRQPTNQPFFFIGEKSPKTKGNTQPAKSIKGKN
jgi:hypothetical protein